MQNMIIRLKNNTRLFLLFTFTASLLITGAWLLPRVSASISEGKGKKSEDKEANKGPEWLTRARRLRRQMHGFESSDRKGASKHQDAANDFSERLVEQPTDPVSPFDFSPGRLFIHVF